jgi:signal transduction histidine kinase
MDAKTTNNLFHPFHATKEVGESPRLGTVLVYALIIYWGGRVWVDSAPGAGTTVGSALPPVDATAAIEVGALAVPVLSLQMCGYFIVAWMG